MALVFGEVEANLFYVPTPRSSSILVHWCRDIVGPAHDYFEVYRYDGFIPYLVVEDPENLTDDEYEKIKDENIEFYDTEEKLFTGCSPFRKYVMENSNIVGATKATYGVDNSVTEGEYYTYLVAGILEKETGGDTQTYIPTGSEPNNWYRKMSDLYECAINSMSATKLTVVNDVWNKHWKPSLFCGSEFGRFTTKGFEPPDTSIYDKYVGLLLA
jgi:hypothetical protein